MCPKCGFTLVADASGISECPNTNCPWLNAKGYPWRSDPTLIGEIKTAIVAAPVSPTEIPNQ